MTKSLTKEQLMCLSPEDSAALHESNDLLVITLEPADNNFLQYVAQHAAKWIKNAKGVALDTRRLVEDREWIVPMLTTDFLPKTVIINPARWQKDEFCQQIPLISMDQFYSWPAVHVDYEGAFELVFRHSTYYHHAQVSTTDFCNLKCRGCAYHGEDPRYGFKNTRAERPRREISDENYYSFIDQLPKGKDLLFCPSGELFVSKKAMAHVRYACEHGLYVRIVTNGMLITPSIAEELVELDVGAVIFSIDGHRADLVEQIRYGANFELILNNLTQLQKLRDQACSDMSIAVTCGWFQELRPFRDEIVDFWKNRNVDTFSFFEEKLKLFSNDRISILDSPGRDNSAPCFQNLVTNPLLTSGKVAPCTFHFPIEWSKIDTSWMLSIKDHSFEEICKHYRQMRLDPDSPYRKNCSICDAKAHCYMTHSKENIAVDAYNFTGRRTKGEAGFVKDYNQRDSNKNIAGQEDVAHGQKVTNKNAGKITSIIKKIFR